MYYPKSQIVSNLYTTGGDPLLINAQTQELYIGYYFKTSKGEYFSGRNPSDRPNVPLIKLVTDGEENPSASNWDPNVPPWLSIPYEPYFSPTPPTPQQYQNGEFRRLFASKTNEIKYIEINKTQFDQLVAKNNNITWSLYKAVSLPWVLTGNKEQVAQINKNVAELTAVRQKMPGFLSYLKFDFTKYYQ